MCGYPRKKSTNGLTSSVKIKARLGMASHLRLYFAAEVN